MNKLLGLICASFKEKMYQTCLRYIQIKSVLIFRKKSLSDRYFFKILLNYNFNIFYFLKIKIIKLN